MLNTFKFIARHPLTKDRKIAAFMRLLKYQLTTRTCKRAEMPWIGDAKLVVAKHMTGASGNIYCGLHELSEMGFLLHFLRPGDLFLDIGANVGSFTVLASKLCGARAIAFEPDAETLEDLSRNIIANDIGTIVIVAPYALAGHNGTVEFTAGFGSMNRIVDGLGSQLVQSRRLDDYLQGNGPTAIKMDVEGSEGQVMQGAALTLANPKLQVVETEGTSEDVVQPLLANGFSRAYYDPIKRKLTSSPNTLDVSNALFIRDFDACQARIASAPRRQILPGLTL